MMMGAVHNCKIGWFLAALGSIFAVGQYVVLSKQLQHLRTLLCKEEKERAAERAGRIRAQKELREKVVPQGVEASSASYPFTPVGTLRSCFSTRNGTPRQPLLVPLSRARLTLTPGGVPAMVLDGLAQYSHCWILYVFHENTDLGRLWTDPDNKNFRAKVKVPRLNGGRLGVLATRSPHRPCPIGLSVAKIEGVDGPNLYLSGVDIVDGSPVLDVKPYLAYCDAVSDASAPSWVEASGAEDPLVLKDVRFASGVDDALQHCWSKMGKRSLYDSPQELRSLVTQVLSRDIRSVHQRQAVPGTVLASDSEPATRIPQTSSGPTERGLIDRGDTGGTTKSGRALQKSGSTTADAMSCALGEARAFEERNSKVEKKDEDGGRTKARAVLYHLFVEGIDFAYIVDVEGNVIVHGVNLRTQV